MELEKDLISNIPKEVSHVTSTLESAGFEAYLVGGCVRDLIMGRVPKDWDVTTNATPEQIVALFEKTVYENTFGTVGVCLPSNSGAGVPHETSRASMDSARHDFAKSDVSRETPEYMIIEVTPFRIEANYTDNRHPDAVMWGKKVEEDLERRDFTINAMAYRKNALKDIYSGLKDIKDMSVRAVGSPDERFSEDALRMLRAVRFAVQLNFSISHETAESISKNSDLIKKISGERVRDEFSKIIMSPNPAVGIVMLQKFGLLKHIIPELEEGIGCEQLGEHVYDVWDHLLHALTHAADKSWPLEIRLAALFHDIGKPRSRRLAEHNHGLSHSHSVLGEQVSSVGSEDSHNHDSAPQSSKKKYTFYGHEVIGARMAKKIMERLKFTKKETELVEKLVRNHMFFSDTELITLSAVRRIIAKVSKESIWLLMNIREADRVGMKKKEAPYRLRKYFAMIEEALHDPISVGQLKINGEYLMKELGIKPGPRMGWILHALLEEVLENTEKNTVAQLSLLVKDLEKLSDKELKDLGDKGKEKKEELEEEEVGKLHSKHGVKK